ncbi:MAG: P-II family nitrogen regulator, partial [Pseudolabrys sp.]
GKGAGGSYRPTELDLTYHHFLQLQIICAAGAASQICRKIAAAAWTGRKGDGVIFTSPAHAFGRIREIGRWNEEDQHD